MDSVTADAGLVVRTRVAAAATALGAYVTYTWSAAGDGLDLVVDIAPDGAWTDRVAKLGVVLTLPATLDRVTWWGRGPGESYPDTGMAARYGEYTATVAELQTPYIRPQENGRRADVRWATLTDSSGSGVRVSGTGFGLTARPWTDAALAAAKHRNELVPGEEIELIIDAGHQGIGTGSCGPGTLPEYDLYLTETSLHLHLAPVR